VRVTRSEVDLPHGTDAHSDLAYRTARANLDRFVADGILIRDPEPRYYFYGQTMGDHTQVGILAGCSVKEYDEGLIAKHELTRPDKEDDRTHHMDVLDAQVGLVFLAYRPTAELDRLTAVVTSREPEWEVTSEDGVVHRLWVAPPERTGEIGAAFEQVPKLYVADGHHRSAAASRIHALRGDEASAWFLCGLFPSDRLQVLPYNRVVRDLHGLTADQLRERIAASFEAREDGRDRPARRGEFSMYLDGRWTTLVARPSVRSADPVGGLDVSILQDHLLRPILGIDDPRRSERIAFVGGIRGSIALSDAVDRLDRAAGAAGAVAFALYPTSLDELFAVADAGHVMPPKSTWFEPKLREGVVVRSLG
jgi:uncharacterized protein (DUF1015 family)